MVVYLYYYVRMIHIHADVYCMCTRTLISECRNKIYYVCRCWSLPGAPLVYLSTSNCPSASKFLQQLATEYYKSLCSAILLMVHRRIYRSNGFLHYTHPSIHYRLMPAIKDCLDIRSDKFIAPLVPDLIEPTRTSEFNSIQIKMY